MKCNMVLYYQPMINLGSHLVATGHHSRQTEIIGQLLIGDQVESENYSKRKSLNTIGGQVLTGHIVESQVGKYESKNIIVKEATVTIDKIIFNIKNPFFGEQ